QLGRRDGRAGGQDRVDRVLVAGQPGRLEDGVEQVGRRPGRQPDHEQHVDGVFVDLLGRKPLDLVTAISHHVVMVLRSRSNTSAPQSESAALGTAALGTAVSSPAAEQTGRAITAMMRQGAVPGMSVAVVRHDRLLYAQAFGWADLAARLTTTPSTSY